MRRSGEGWLARCPAHADRRPSLSVREGEEGRVLLKCFAGCEVERVVAAAGLGMRDLFPDAEGGAPTPGSGGPAAEQPAGGCSLERYGQAKKLPAGFLRELGLSEITYLGRPAVRIPYLDTEGSEAAVRFRLALAKSPDGPDNRFRWKKGSKLCLYGLDRLRLAREAGYVILVEGESDCHTLWYHGHPALGLPGANTWNENRDAGHLDGIDTIHVLVEPDTGGQATLRWLHGSRIRDRVQLVSLDRFKDVSELHLADPGRFTKRLDAALRAATCWTDHQQAQRQLEHATSWQRCRDLAECPDILAAFAADLRRQGVVGEERLIKLLYLAVTGRLLERPVSLVVKGPSSAGKSYTVEQVLRLFPDAAYYALSAMSERALAYSEEPLKHRMLVIYETAGLESEFASYLMRSLLSEGRINYETVEKTSQGIKARLIEREGPTGLIVTTTKAQLHPENETRLLSLTVTDTPDQTRAVLLALADDSHSNPDLEPWQALQRWLASNDTHVTVPYARQLAEAIPPVAVRLRRDFAAILTLIKAHALLHTATRQHDPKGRILATIGDYTAVRNLVGDLISDAADATVPDTVRETVQAVPANGDGISVKELAGKLRLDKSAATRRWQTARQKGYLRNLEDRPGRPAKIVRGERLPDNVEILPTPQTLADRFKRLADRCTVDPETPGITTPPPPDNPAPATPPTAAEATATQTLAEPGASQDPPPCPHPAHRETDPAGESGRLVCGTCHPQPNQGGTA